jgi:C_GCAxxG_C_C family probable redox protein
MDDLESMQEYKSQGFNCSQIIIKMGLDLQGKENPDLVKEMQGLAGGLGYTGDVCGVLTGAVCLLGIYAGKGKPGMEDDPRLLLMIEELLKWFEKEYGKTYGGIHCSEIVNDNSKKMAERCP